jgi:L-fuculose-phosphate aldolase
MLDTICDVLKAAYERGWISTRDGNASFRRRDESYLYITPSGVRKQHLNAEMIIKMEYTSSKDTHTHLERVNDDYQRKIVGLEPSGEIALHSKLQAVLPENRVVLHFHPTYIIAAMYAGVDLQKVAREFPEINRYTKVGPVVRMLPPISEELARESIKALELDESTGRVKYDIIGLDRHGIVAVGKDAWTVYEHVERLEHICQIVLASGDIAELMRFCD